MLESWNDGATKDAIADFVGRAVRDVSPEERVAVFDNDGTLWCARVRLVCIQIGETAVYPRNRDLTAH